MTMFSNNSPEILNTPTMPTGQAVARFKTYKEAQTCVDYLADRDFPVQGVSIVGSDLKQVERVMGKLTMPRVAMSGALSGAWLGIFGGFILSMGSSSNNFGMVPVAIAIGAAMGVIFAVVSHSFSKGQRDFTSMSQVVASAYEVIVDNSVAVDASKMLHEMSSGTKSQETRESVESTPSASSEKKEQSSEAATHAPAKTHYDDLEDGRPRYGVRSDDSQNN